jgi:hypothetical protein
VGSVVALANTERIDLAVASTTQKPEQVRAPPVPLGSSSRLDKATAIDLPKAGKLAAIAPLGVSSEPARPATRFSLSGIEPARSSPVLAAPPNALTGAAGVALAVIVPRKAIEDVVNDAAPATAVPAVLSVSESPVSALTSPLPGSSLAAQGTSNLPTLSMFQEIPAAEGSGRLPAATPMTLVSAETVAIGIQSRESAGLATLAPMETRFAQPVRAESAVQPSALAAVPSSQELGKAYSPAAMDASRLGRVPGDDVRVPRARPAAAGPAPRAEPQKQQTRPAAAVSKPKPTRETRRGAAESKAKPVRRSRDRAAESKPKPTRPRRAEAQPRKTQPKAPAPRATVSTNQRARTATTRRQAPASAPQASAPARQARAPARQNPAPAQRPAALAPTRTLPPSLLPTRPPR